MLRFEAQRNLPARSPRLCGLDFGIHPYESFPPVNFERFTGGKLSYIPANVKLRELPGKAGGLPKGNYRDGLFLRVLRV